MIPVAYFGHEQEQAALTRSEVHMISNFDHVTLAVTDLEEAIRFFGLLGFELARSVVISGEAMDEYMGASGLEADHVTLVIPEAQPRQEVQLLRYHRPPVAVDGGSGDLLRTGFNHVCFRVPNLDSVLDALAEAGVKPRNEPMVFQERKLVFINGPSNVVVELAEWLTPAGEKA
jgi:catechol 2,3-dioxygenase-like lactoylglutathione lyase family enzyme